jgi:hypothetical protein
MNFLIIAHLGDETALRVSAKLVARHGRRQVKVVSSEELVLAPYWAHWLEGSCVRTELRLSDNTVLDSASIDVVFNRLMAVTVPHFASATEMDQDYAAREMHALCLSWLASLPCPVVNAPTPTSLGAQTRSHAEWLLCAGKAGLPVQGYCFTTDPRWSSKKAYSPYQWCRGWQNHASFLFERDHGPPVCREPRVYLEPLSEPQESVLIAGPYVVGRLAGLYFEQLKYLGKTTGCDLLQVTFAPWVPSETNLGATGNWKVCGVNSFPQVKTAEDVSALVNLLESKVDGLR